jgi:hypothetical protein
VLLVSGSSWFSSYCDKIKEDEMGVTCGTRGGEQKCILGKVLWGNLKEGDNFKDKSVDGGIILK